MKTNENHDYPYAGPVLPGFLMLIINLLAIFPLAGYCFMSETIPAAVAGTLIGIVGFVMFGGYFIQDPNQAQVLLFFGNYKGTCRKVGFYWINPFLTRKKISLRIHNIDITPIKVNDKVGNPVMIGMVMVWRIKDTYRAIFDLGSQGYSNYTAAFENFVRIQSDAALREVTGHYPYDAEHEHELSLRSSGEEINLLLVDKINERLAIAGMEVVEARINYLAYAPEIASVMLKRQQAAAVISAREKIVEGAVSMVKLALDRIESEKVASFSEEQRAQTVSNLMLVLCSDEPLSPVINAGK